MSLSRSWRGRCGGNCLKLERAMRRQLPDAGGGDAEATARSWRGRCGGNCPKLTRTILSRCGDTTRLEFCRLQSIMTPSDGGPSVTPITTPSGGVESQPIHSYADLSPAQGEVKPGFWWLIVTQFKGEFSDNAMKSVVTFMGLAVVRRGRGLESVVPLLGVLFSVPFLLFSMTGGWLADRYSKRTVTIGVKAFEIGVMTVTTAALGLGLLPVAMAGVFLMGVHSAIFGPAKYGMLPEILPKSRLSWGNGVIEMTTFLAIIAGGAAGAVLFSVFKGQLVWAGAALLVLAGGGLVCSFGITRLPAASPAKKFRANFL